MVKRFSLFTSLQSSRALLPNSKSIGKKFMRIVQQVVKSAKVTHDQIKWDIDPISEYFAT